MKEIFQGWTRQMGYPIVSVDLDDNGDFLVFKGQSCVSFGDLLEDTMCGR